VTRTDIFKPFLQRWNLLVDGEPIVTHSSRLLPVRHNSEAAMLKVALEDEERRGADLMTWWNGEGAARVLAHDGDGLLLERLPGTRSLAEMAWSGQDDEATRIICTVAGKLHAPRPEPLPELIELERWFSSLAPMAAAQGGILRLADKTARELFSDPREIGALHGDLHHDNVLDGGDRGWLAVDPKRLIGERGFDFANLFRNPDISEPAPLRSVQTIAVATVPGRLARQAHIVAQAARLERERLLKWVLAYCGLSAAWHLEDGNVPELDLAVASIAAAELGLA
jgi:streptomycin 6-kinase